MGALEMYQQNVWKDCLQAMNDVKLQTREAKRRAVGVRDRLDKLIPKGEWLNGLFCVVPVSSSLFCFLLTFIGFFGFFIQVHLTLVWSRLGGERECRIHLKYEHIYNGAMVILLSVSTYRYRVVQLYALQHF